MLKIRNYKIGGIREKWTPNLLDFNINSTNLVHVCGYKLPINDRNLAEIGASKGYFFLLILLCPSWIAYNGRVPGQMVTWRSLPFNDRTKTNYLRIHWGFSLYPRPRNLYC